MTDSTPVSPVPVPAASGRYSLDDTGAIFFQPDATNPLPGSPVGKVTKGDAMLSPTTDHEAAKDWLAIHIRTVLEPLFLLKQEAGEGALPEGAPRDIGAQLYEHLGVMHRADLEDHIAKLDPETRKTLRSKGVRLGPILVFLPALVKPAAVKMRALLWGLWNDKTLPVAKPADGRVSEVVDTNAVDRNFYRMIGYPVFGPRAIRIDMLDRVLTDVYDTADKGIFEAKHKYAEWLGTNLEDLYAILESMGHRKMKEEAAPVIGAESALVVAAEAAPATEAETTVEAVTAVETATDAPGLENIQPVEVTLEGADVSAPVAEVIATAKPVVASVKFMLKRGKMSDRPQSREKKERGGKRNHKSSKPKKPSFDPNKPVMLTDEDKARINARAEERQKQKESRQQDSRPKGGRDRDRDRDDRGAQRPKDKRNQRTESNEGRVYTFEAEKKSGDDDSNPFAILKNLKK